MLAPLCTSCEVDLKLDASEEVKRTLFFIDGVSAATQSRCLRCQGSGQHLYLLR